MFRPFLIAVFAAIAPIDGAGAGSAGDAARATTAEPTAGARIRADVAFLADDARAGREAGTPGYDAAARYVAERFRQIGLAPAGDDGTYLQDAPLVSSKRVVESGRFVLIDSDGRERVLENQVDFFAARTAYAAFFDVTAPLVFAGYGVVDPRKDYDDYRGIDARGKIVLALSGAPANFSTEEAAYHRSEAAKRRAAEERGAVAVVTLPTQASAKRFPWARLRQFIAAERMAVAGGAPPLEAGAVMSVEGAARLFQGERRTYAQIAEAVANDPKTAPGSFALTASARISGASTIKPVKTANVVGFIKGADPALGREVVVLTAHLDHVGVADRAIAANSEDEPDRINNGALDNAIGVAMLIEAARALKSGPPPRRSVVFAALTAEEKGLVGAAYYAKNPPKGLETMVANVNLDMPLVLFPFTDVIAFGAERSSLGDDVAAIARDMSLGVIPDPIPQLSIFTRSDHYRFVLEGVPSVFLFVGFGGGGEATFGDFMQNHYHRPSDEIDLPIDYVAAARFAELNRRLARRIADADAAPQWNDGDLFGALAQKRAAP